jgi:CheY-like chemotaxis protein
VLVVDDEPALCDLACSWLESLGYAPIGVHSPQEALALLSEQRFSTLFTDVVMPGPMDGITLAREALRRQPGIRVVLTSGYAQRLIDEPDPPGQLLNKPYRKKELAALFAKVAPLAPTH